MNQYRVFYARKFGRNMPRHISQVIAEAKGRGFVSLYGTALCGVNVANYPETGDLGRPENAHRRCPRCWAKYTKLLKNPVLHKADIVAARTDPRGECSCEFVEGARKGEFTRPTTDPHCPVHNEEPMPLTPESCRISAEDAAHREYLAAQEDLSRAQERFQAACVALGKLAEARHGH